MDTQHRSKAVHKLINVVKTVYILLDKLNQSHIYKA